MRQVYLEKKNRYFLSLPKLNDTQLEILSERLTTIGYKLRAGSKVKASMGSSVLWLESRGVAYSTSDLLDQIAPIIPRLLEVKKSRVTPRSLVNMYYATRSDAKSVRIRFNPRIESMSIWRALRGADESGLTPDEALVLKVLLSHARGRIQAIVDYPNEGAGMIQIGRRVYFDSSLEVAEFVSNLRILGQKNRRNAYLPRNCMIELNTFELPRVEDLNELSEELGEWCYYSTQA
jgi:hypothetical protein